MSKRCSEFYLSPRERSLQLRRSLDCVVQSCAGCAGGDELRVARTVWYSYVNEPKTLSEWSACARVARFVSRTRRASEEEPADGPIPRSPGFLTRVWVQNWVQLKDE